MDAITYLYTNKFILISFDGNLELKIGDMNVKLIHIKKVHIVNNTTAVSVIGNLHKMTKLYQYILELCRLNKNISSTEILSDIKDLLPKDVSNFQNVVKTFTEISERINEGISKDEEEILLQQLKNNQDVQDLIGNKTQADIKSNLNVFLFFNYLPELGMNGVLANIMNNYVIESPPFNKINKNEFFLGIVSTVQQEETVVPIREKYINELKKIFVGQWEDTITAEMIEDARKIIENCISNITTFKSKPDVYHFEIGEHTGNIFTMPSRKLNDLSVTNSKENEQ